MSIKSASGKPIDPRYVELSMIMLKYDIKAISFDYSGSGDEGAIDDIKVEPYNSETFEKIIPDERNKLNNIAEEIFFEIVSPNFNNTGSYGTANFLMDTEGKMSFDCDHHDIIETTDDVSFTRNLLDTSDL